MAIPSIAHFIWLGKQLPAIAYLAVRAAQQRAGLAELVLHTDSDELLQHHAVVDLMQRGIRVLRLRMDVRDEPERGIYTALHKLVRHLAHPAAQADVWRLIVLWQHGGIYFDSDAIVLRCCNDLLQHRGFAGLERICLPAALYQSRNPLRWARAGALLSARQAISYLPQAQKTFSKISKHYDLACNNAVLGSEPKHPLVRQLLKTIANMPLHQASQLYELGPRLLENATHNRSTPTFTLLSPAHFYPLSPEICWDYLRHDPKGLLGDTPDPQTFAAHLYDSVLARRLKAPLSADFIELNRRNTLLGRMVEPFIDDLAALQARGAVA